MLSTIWGVTLPETQGARVKARPTPICGNDNKGKKSLKKESRIPAASGVPSLSKADEPRTPDEAEDMKAFPYREAVGALMWLTTMTRPDIACAVRAVARFCENPGPAHKKRQSSK